MKYRNRHWPLATAGALVFSLLIFPLFILATNVISEEASPIYYETSLARTFSTPAKHKGCVYNKLKFNNGDEVPTDQPCLKCLCRKGLLMCSLRICPPVTGNFSGPSSRCKLVREANACCPIQKCSPEPAEGHNDSASPDHHAEHTVANRSNLISLNSAAFANLESINSANRSEAQSSIVQIRHIPDRNTTIIQTVPYVSNLLSGSGKNCFVNGTIYSSGSALGSSSFCEYCYCINGKRLCIRPRCHLSLFSCYPKFSSEFSCCPTSYECRNEALSTEYNSGPEEKLPHFYAFNEKLGPNNTTAPRNSNEFDAENELRSVDDNLLLRTTTSEPAESATDASLITTTAVPVAQNSPPLGAHLKNCLFNGVSYNVGDSMPSESYCMHCACGNGTRRCQPIKCSLEIGNADFCTPVIPDGHCCPIEYKCGTQAAPLLPAAEHASSHKEESHTTDHSPVQSKQSLPGASQNNSIEESTATAIKEQVVNTTSELNTAPTEEKLPTAGTEEPVVSGIFANDTELKSTTKPIAENTLEARNLSDDPQFKEYSKARSEHETVNAYANSSNGTAANTKLENVAHFLSNFFNVLGLTGKVATEHRKPTLETPKPLAEHSVPNSPNSVMLVENEDHLLPSIVLSATGDQMEIITAQPPSSVDTVVGASMQSGQVAGTTPKPPMEMVKSIRDLPHHPSSYLSKNVPMDNHKMPTFSNGWRAIPSMKPTSAPSTSTTELTTPQSANGSKVVCVFEGKERKVYTCRSNDTLTERSSVDAPEPSKATAAAGDAAPSDFLAKSRFESSRPPSFVPQNQPRITFPFDPIPRPLDLSYGSRLDNRVHFPHKNKPPSLPPNLILQQPHLPNPILDLHKPLLNRPLFGPQLSGGFNPGPKVEDKRGGSSAPIRPMPQSPIGDEVKVIATTETTSPPSSTTSSTEPPSSGASWDILLQVSGCNIFGTLFKVGQEVGQLSTACKTCKCSPQGLHCRILC